MISTMDFACLHGHLMFTLAYALSLRHAKREISHTPAEGLQTVFRFQGKM
jgi:hypothetical protein